MAHINANY